jgi:predicted O-methyltransferase YrrM
VFDIAPYLNPDDGFVRNEGLGLVRRIYAEKHAVASLLRPRSVLEIGVRYGYSAAAFLAAVPGARYYGLDKDSDSHGGTRDSYNWALKMLAEKFPLAAVSVAVQDTSELLTLPGLAGAWDLVHVDGDHSEAGCTHDLGLALAARPKWILVDDLTHLFDVARAVHEFLARHPVRHVQLPTVRGDMLIQV